MKKIVTFVAALISDFTADTVKDYIATIRQADTLAKTAKTMRAALISAAEQGKLAELFPCDGNTYTVYADSKLRNTVTYIEPSESSVVDMDAVKAFYAEHNEPLPMKKQSRSATLRIN